MTDATSLPESDKTAAKEMHGRVHTMATGHARMSIKNTLSDSCCDS